MVEEELVKEYMVEVVSYNIMNNDIEEIYTVEVILV